MKDLEEYLRRNLLHAKAVGVAATIGYILKRLRDSRNPPKWLLRRLVSIQGKAEAIHPEMAKHRNEVE